ncbi:TAXI family TRAP transporter solute-binding subunit [Leucobacter insecticola]|uniref:TAXI family TRAP transporter solute-binding subunit n=1 Tax=Leucobacter insecticola TaxID=2714934 RepID=A0A6G8FK48_9MICO|nr:TAXI family TRAP transporter solute-binding subunit [Leucobacter insecticola]QIM16673.1 TAXI family TRAP transporter solute-binding subunit [Leucobacter insecticola]
MRERWRNSGAGPRTRLRLLAGLLVTVYAVAALAGCDSAASSAGRQVIAGGASTGIYYAYSSGFAEQLRVAGFDIVAEETGGSVDNLMRVGSGDALLGFAQADTAADAVAGVGAFHAKIPIAAVARVYDEYVQLVVPASSAVRQLSDLPGLRVSVGEKHSGVTVIADRVLLAGGVREGTFTRRELGIDDSIAALERGEIDAFFWVGGVPTPGIESLSERVALRMIPIGPETVERMDLGRAGVYRVSALPLGAYDTSGTVETMMVPNYLVTSTQASEHLVFEVTKALFESRAELSRTVPAVALLDPRQAIFTSPVPLHPGAEKYYVQNRNNP